MNESELGDIRQALLRLARQRGPDKSFCPSEVARQLATDWRPLMQPVRAVSAELCEEKLLRATQRGKTVDPLDASGPIRLSLR